MTNTDDFNPHKVSAGCGNVEPTKVIVERGAALKNAKKCGVTALMVIARSGKL